MYEFVSGDILFDPGCKTEILGMDPSESHLARISGLLGRFPLNLVRKAADQTRYFDRQGQFSTFSCFNRANFNRFDIGNLLKGLGQHDMLGLHGLLSRADRPAEHVPLTVDFLCKALMIDPEERWSAGQLLEHPWLKDVS